MQQYIFKRLLLAVPTLIGVSMIVFFMLRVLPGDLVQGGRPHPHRERRGPGVEALLHGHGAIVSARTDRSFGSLRAPD